MLTLFIEVHIQRVVIFIKYEIWPKLRFLALKRKKTYLPFLYQHYLKKIKLYFKWVWRVHAKSVNKVFALFVQMKTQIDFTEIYGINNITITGVLVLIGGKRKISLNRDKFR